MKSGLTSIVFILLFQFCKAQLSTQTEENPMVPKSYIDNRDALMKHRNSLNTIGWSCLGGGLALGFIGALETIGSAFQYNKNTNGGEALFTIGNVVALGSVPFFIIAHKYKMKARLALKGETLNMNYKNTNYTAIALRYNF